ncbi:MAG: proton-conducting transporter membrane subunit [Actinomycetota bacterium]|nr:proton-conducting transporter membrane subunit [Actinomycetota bacterium]
MTTYLTSHSPVLMEIIFLAGAALTPIISLIRKKLAFWWALIVSTLGFYFCMLAAAELYRSGPLSYYLGGWRPPYGIEIKFDYLGAFAFLILLLNIIIMVYSKKYMEHEISEDKLPIYYTLVLLLVGGMVGVTITGDIFNMFVFMEILSLAGYSLIAITEERLNAMASFKYLVMGALSSLLLLVGIAFIYNVTGSLNMADISLKLQQYGASTTAYVAVAALIIGFTVKAAMFPVHIWLPDAHGLAPSPVSALLSGLVIKIGIVGILRIVFSIYRIAGPINFSYLLDVLAWFATATVIFGAFFAFFQDDLKIILAYSSVSNIGYILMGIGLISVSNPAGSVNAMLGALTHVAAHAIIKSLLFLSAGAIIYKTGLRKLNDLKGIGKKMPITCMALVIGALSITGVPGTVGFWAKWYVINGAFDSGRLFFAIAMLVGALMVFAYYIKIINVIFFRIPENLTAEVDEAPLSMLIPIVILAASCLVYGLFYINPMITNYFMPAAKSLLGLAM